MVILKLGKPLELNDDVKPACLPSSNYLDLTSTEDRCFTSGWGHLQEGKNKFFKHSLCKSVCSSYYFPKIRLKTYISGKYPNILSAKTPRNSQDCGAMHDINECWNFIRKITARQSRFE